jgi:hypothetical protein
LSGLVFFENASAILAGTETSGPAHLRREAKQLVLRETCREPVHPQNQ